MERRRGRPPKSPTSGNALSANEIVARYRERMRAAGKFQATYWLELALVDKIKEIAAKEGKTASDIVEKILLEALKKRGGD